MKIFFFIPFWFSASGCSIPLTEIICFFVLQKIRGMSVKCQEYSPIMKMMLGLIVSACRLSSWLILPGVAYQTFVWAFRPVHLPVSTPFKFTRSISLLLVKI